ncbi:MAG: DUF2490 domain-containing protein [Cytophagales bacterium]|nr:DUF2490 domain-containing protein [Cytophagales bacterium]
MGYAWLSIYGTTYTNLSYRPEHRPWCQMVWESKMFNNFTLGQRLRYDLRFRGHIENSAVTDEFDFNHRLRYLFSVKYRFPMKEWLGGKPFVGITNETLVNFGQEIIYNHLDQNRLWATVGYQWANVNFQVGYMNRYIPVLPKGEFIHNHTLILWVTHSLDFRKKGSSVEDLAPDLRHP